MLRIGLTGSIATGKTFVCEVLRDLGCHVLDADQSSRDVVARGTEGLGRIVGEFGDDILLCGGELDRKKMGAIVFNDESKRLLLNSIIHPLVRDVQDRWITNLEAIDPNGIAIVDAALTIESGGYKRFDKLIVVWCKPAIQLKRLMLRDNLGEIDAQKRIAAQMPQEEKKVFADYLIDTTDGFDEARSQTLAVFRELDLQR